MKATPMVSIASRLAGSSHPQRIQELKLGKRKESIMVFTDDGDVILLHWIDDDTIKSFVICPGAGCPECYLGNPPEEFSLLPVLHHDRREVKVLRISNAQGSTSLGTLLGPHLRDPDIANKLLLVSRREHQYEVHSMPLNDEADRCLGVIDRFLKARTDGWRLDSAFMRMSPVELADIPSIRNALEARGGWEPPAA